MTSEWYLITRLKQV